MSWRPRTPLFRREALAQQEAAWLGTVLLAPRRSHSIMAVLALAMVGVLGLLLCANYTRTARVNGMLIPDPGLVRIFAPLQGVLVAVNVREGDQVKRGQPLLVISTEIQTQALGDAREVVLHRLQTRRDSMLAVRSGQDQQYIRQSDSLTKRLQASEASLTQIGQEMALLRARMTLAAQTLERERGLYGRRLVSIQNVTQAQDVVLTLASQLRSLERQRSTLEQERVGLAADLGRLPFQHEAELADTDRNVAALEQEIAENEAKRRLVLAAPEDGTVGSVQAEVGSSVGTAVPLVSIIPAGATLQAQLFAPSRAVGFVTQGQHVLLRYQPFPYQKFGSYEGTVTSVSRTAVSPADLPQQFTGLTSLFENNAPIYRITVTLARQDVTTYGRSVPLQPGMQLEADILVEKRRLIEWVFDPLYTLTGRWQR